jgi:hypothetical protein
VRLLLSRTDYSICVNNPEPHFAADEIDPPTTRGMEICAPAVFAECFGGFRVKRESLQAKTAFSGTNPITPPRKLCWMSDLAFSRQRDSAAVAVSKQANISSRMVVGGLGISAQDA